MSLTLLKQSLDILEQDDKDSKTKQKETKSRIARGKQKQQIRFNHKVKDNQVKKINDIRNEINQSTHKSKENLKRLLMFSKDTVLKNDDAVKIVKRAHKGRYVDVELPKKEIESVFTEEDFRAFEEEYFKS